MKKTWGGRFRKSTNPQVEAFTESISFDQRLASFDIEGSLAHVQTLVKARLLKPSEGKKLSTGLQKVKKLLKARKLPMDSSQEDIHTAIESALTRIVGPLGENFIPDDPATIRWQRIYAFICVMRLMKRYKLALNCWSS